MTVGGTSIIITSIEEKRERERMTANQSNEIHLIKHHIDVREREREWI